MRECKRFVQPVLYTIREKKHRYA